MSTTQSDTWIEGLDIADRPTATDVREFFGVPPSPVDELDKNISKKRRTWSSRKRGRKTTPEAEEQIDAALKLIAFLAQALKRGGDGPFDLDELRDVFREAPKAKVGELGELWELVERLLAAGKLDEALKVGYDARDRFTDSVVPHAVFAWVASIASRGLAEADDRMREEGLRSADIAIAEPDAAPETFGARATLQLDLRRGPEALETLIDAERRLDGGLNANLEILLVEAYVSAGKVEEAVRRAIDAVQDAPDDLSIRSSVTLTLVQAIQYSLLPIRSKDDLARYQRVVEVAAWCADGAPEAEDSVRPFRMWAVVADNVMYGGDIERRAYAGVLTGFLILPLLNRIKGKPQWQIIDQGPESVSPEVFAEVALGAISTFVHEAVKDRLTWWNSYMAQARRDSNGGSR